MDSQAEGAGEEHWWKTPGKGKKSRERGGGGRAEKKAVRLDTYRQRFESDHFPHGFAFLFTFIGTVLL